MNPNKNRQHSKSEAEIKPTDVLGRLTAYPHVLEEIFSACSYMTLLRAEKVSSMWRQMISTSTIWKDRWEENVMSSPTWQSLAVRLEHRKPNLFCLMEEGNYNAFRQAYENVEQNVQQILQYEGKKRPFYPLSLTDRIVAFAVNDRNVFIGLETKIVIVNRWTRELIKKIPISNWISDLQLNHRVLAVKSYDESIIIYDLDTFEEIQKITDLRDPEEEQFSNGFRLEGDFLVNMKNPRDRMSLKIGIRLWNPTTGQFGDIEKQQFFYYGIEVWREQIYFYENYLIIDVQTVAYPQRMIAVLDVDSMEVVRYRNFRTWNMDSGVIKQECHGGVIVVEDRSDEDEPFLNTWNIENDTVGPSIKISSCSDKFILLYSAAMTHHHSYQFVLSESNSDSGKVSLNVLPSVGKDCNEDSVLKKNSMKEKNFTYGSVLNVHHLYFDGIQCIFKEERGLYFIEFVDDDPVQ